MDGRAHQRHPTEEALNGDFEVRALTRADLSAVEAIYRRNAPAADPRAWRARLAAMVEGDASEHVLLVATEIGTKRSAKVIGYLAGEAHTWEFGSEPAGWIVAVGVDPSAEGRGVGGRLRAEAVAAFREMGMATVRTMVRHDDVNVLRFFRDGGFKGGPYVELELTLD